MKRDATSGFTLMEVVVATAVMVTVIASVAHVVLLAAARSVTSRGDLQALILSQGKLDELRASPGVPTSGDDLVEGKARRWLVAPVDSNLPAAVSIRVCIDAASLCVAGVRVIRP